MGFRKNASFSREKCIETNSNSYCNSLDSPKNHFFFQYLTQIEGIKYIESLNGRTDRCTKLCLFETFNPNLVLNHWLINICIGAAKIFFQ